MYENVQRKVWFICMFMNDHFYTNDSQSRFRNIFKMLENYKGFLCLMIIALRKISKKMVKK